MGKYGVQKELHKLPSLHTHRPPWPTFRWSFRFPPSGLCPEVLFCLSFCRPVFQLTRSQIPEAACLVLGLCVLQSMPRCPGLDILGTLLLESALFTWSHPSLATRCLSDAMSHRVAGGQSPASLGMESGFDFRLYHSLTVGLRKHI